MNSKSTAILAAAIVFGGHLPPQLTAKEPHVEVRRAAQGNDIRQSRGADDAALNADGTPHIRRSRGADDAVLNADGTPHIRRSRGADDAALKADGTPHIRQSRGADDSIVTAAGALVPTAAALSAPAAPKPRSRVENVVAFGPSAQPAHTQGLTPQAIHRGNEKPNLLAVSVAGYAKGEHTPTADLENGEVIGNLPDKERLYFALYQNLQQAQAAATLWAAPSSETQRADGALVAVETGIITWQADDRGHHSQGTIHGLFLEGDRLPELNDGSLHRKVIQIYGPLVKILDDKGNVLSCTRQVYWTSESIR